MTRADRIAAALEHWKKWAEYLRAFSGNTLGRAADAGDALAALLREPQPAPVVGDDDAALLAKTQDWLCHNLTVTPDSHYRNVQALLERCSAALADLARVRWELATEKDYTQSAYLAAREAGEACGRAMDERNEARAALAAAVEEEEEREALLDDARSVLTNSANYTSGFDPVLKMARAYYSSRDRARAGRNDGT